MSEIYHVVAQRRAVVAQIQLNFKSRKAADEAFAALRQPPPTGRRELEDDFGAKVSFDLSEIGHVYLVDLAQSLEMQVTAGIMAQKAQSKVQREMMKDPLLNGQLIGAAGMPEGIRQ